MDPSQFDHLSKAVAASGSRRTVTRVLAALPLVGTGWLLAEGAEAKRGQKRNRKERDRENDRDEVQDEKRRKNVRKVSLCLNGETIRVSKKRKKTFLNQGATPGACVPSTCVPEARITTCAGKCGDVINNCNQAVDCGSCECDPECGACQRCAGITCEACDPCCDGFCCDRAGSVCNVTTGSCCVPTPNAEVCANKCGTLMNNCNQTVECGGCDNPTPICASNTCVACSGQNPCPNGQVCCGGSCFAGVCCADADCPSQGGNACVGRQCLCSGATACSGATPDCCGDPGTCTNTDTDTNNCGTCGTPCRGATPNCVNGACVADVCGSGCPFNSVQDAINTRPAGSTIYIGAGTFGRITINKNITLIGAGANNTNSTVLDGSASGRVVLVLAGVMATLQDMRITNGKEATGAGVWNLGTLTMTGCTVNSNVGNSGGGGAGGVQNWTSAKLTMTDCTVSNNSTLTSGGGIGNFGTLTLTSCAIRNNHANQTAGGMTNGFGGTITLDGTYVTNNTSGFAPAGIRNDANGNGVTLTNGCEVSSNTPGNCGGGGAYFGETCPA